MKLFRLDAVHDNGVTAHCVGEFTRFFFDEVAAEAEERSLRRSGWLCDVYAIKPPSDRMTRDRLVAGIWPNVHLNELLTLADSPLALAAVQVEQAKALKRIANR
jgi:hypothetical protein